MRGTNRRPAPLAREGEAIEPALRDEVQRLFASAHDLLARAVELGARTDGLDAQPYRPMQSSNVRLARADYAARRLRESFFDYPGLFGEPAWDLLLDLYVASEEGKRMAVTSACIGAAVPVTTALRWLALLEAHGLVCREADPGDARRALVWLSDDAIARMRSYFARLTQTGLR